MPSAKKNAAQGRDAVREGFEMCDDAMPLEKVRQVVLSALLYDAIGDERLKLPKRGNFIVRRVLASEYYFC